MVPELFDQHYSKIYLDRWPHLKASLSLKKLVGFEYLRPSLKIAQMKVHASGQQPERLENGLLKEYFLDPGSVLIARALPVEGASKVLDMCAAPGGKSLVILSRLKPDTEVICNEPSGPRREALKKVIQNYVPRDFRDHVWVKGSDGNQYGLRSQGEFDSILVDAPCSGEAHLLENPSELSNWTPRRSEGLAIKQYSLLSSAWSALKVGGFLVYSTCSISPGENDAVIQKLIKKKKESVKILSPTFEIEPEKTQWGFQFFPDKFGFGPLYGCLVQKLGP